MGDLIERQKALDAIQERVCQLGHVHNPYVLSITKAIRKLPSAEQWIPVSERLPEERQWVLCQCRAKIMEVLRINGDNDWEQLYPKRTFMGSYVLAWMPLPEPYTERRK